MQHLELGFQCLPLCSLLTTVLRQRSSQLKLEIKQNSKHSFLQIACGPSFEAGNRAFGGMCGDISIAAHPRIGNGQKQLMKFQGRKRTPPLGDTIELSVRDEQ